MTSDANDPGGRLVGLIERMLIEAIAPERKAARARENREGARQAGKGGGGMRGRDGAAASSRAGSGRRSNAGKGGGVAVDRVRGETDAMLARMRAVLVREAGRLDDPAIEGKAAVDLVQQIARTLEKITELERAEAAADAARAGLELSAEDRAALRAELDALIRRAAEALVVLPREADEVGDGHRGVAIRGADASRPDDDPAAARGPG